MSNLRRTTKQSESCVKACKDDDESIYHMSNCVYTDSGPQNLTWTSGTPHALGLLPQVPPSNEVTPLSPMKSLNPCKRVDGTESECEMTSKNEFDVCFEGAEIFEAACIQRGGIVYCDELMVEIFDVNSVQR